jgi:peptidoglycan/xylan/chitin deacetylase (PgdA/CDA1 family)
LTAAQIKTMSDAGIEFGSHSEQHDYYPSINLGQAVESLKKSKKTLEQITGKPVRFISYPAGGHTKEIMQATREAGYAAACTTNRGFKKFPVDPYALRRITVHERVKSRLAMALICSGYGTINRRLRPPH